MKSRKFNSYKTQEWISNEWIELDKRMVLVNDISRNFLSHLSSNDLIKLVSFIDKSFNDGSLKLESWEEELKIRRMAKEAKEKEIKET